MEGVQVQSEEEASAQGHDFASALAHDMSHNDFDKLMYVDRVLVIDSGRGGDTQSMMSSLGGSQDSEGLQEQRTEDFQQTRTAACFHSSRRGRRFDSSGGQRETDCKTWQIGMHAGKGEGWLDGWREAEAVLNSNLFKESIQMAVHGL
jgi:hypothetical protein